MTYEELLDRIITDGIAEVRDAYARPEEHHKRDGAIEGFEVCRGKSPAALVALWSAAEAERYAEQTRGDAKDYWRQRYKILQIEWVCNVVSFGLVNSGSPPLLAHLPTARGAMKYAEIVGVRGGGGVPIVTFLPTIGIVVGIVGTGLLVAEGVLWYARRRWIRAARIENPRAARR